MLKSTEHIRKIQNKIKERYSILFINFPVSNLFMPQKLNDFVDKRREKVKDQAYFFASSIYDNEGFIHPKIYSENTASMYWLFVYVLPADYQTQFQKKYLLGLQKCLKEFPKLRPLYATLYDKLALGDGNWQRYGTQSTNASKDNVEDIEGLNERKKAMNLS
jgi:hypothetical protein